MVHQHFTGWDTPFWLICTGGKKDYTAKWWIPEYAQEVVDYFKDRIQFVQFGDEGRLAAVLEVAQARFEADQELKNQVRIVEDKLNERKIVERAKGILMQLRGMNESEAYHAMRRMAMDRNIRIVEVAEKLLAMNDLLA